MNASFVDLPPHTQRRMDASSVGKEGRMGKTWAGEIIVPDAPWAGRCPPGAPGCPILSLLSCFFLFGDGRGLCTCGALSGGWMPREARTREILRGMAPCCCRPYNRVTGRFAFSLWYSEAGPGFWEPDRCGANTGQMRGRPPLRAPRVHRTTNRSMCAGCVPTGSVFYFYLFLCLVVSAYAVHIRYRGVSAVFQRESQPLPLVGS